MFYSFFIVNTWTFWSKIFYILFVVQIKAYLKNLIMSTDWHFWELKTQFMFIIEYWGNRKILKKKNHVSSCYRQLLWRLQWFCKSLFLIYVCFTAVGIVLSFLSSLPVILSTDLSPSHTCLTFFLSSDGYLGCFRLFIIKDIVPHILQDASLRSVWAFPWECILE